VGDIVFQQKCHDVFRRFKQEGRTVVIASHDLKVLRDFCDRVIILEQGSLVAEVNPSDVEEAYRHILQPSIQTWRIDG
jgi:lipopolysaccharide transport system ATP-binding protein